MGVKLLLSLADIHRCMRKKCLIIALLLTVALASNYLGFSRGFAKGAQITNGWWVDQKSIYYDTRQIIHKRHLKKHNCL